jgi:hypothetical protein
MRRGLATILALTVALSASVSGADAVQICLRAFMPCGVHPLTPTITARVSPERLPAHRYAPVRWSFAGRFASDNGGGHPPALREVAFGVDRHVRVDLEELPACDSAKLRRARSARDALKVCGETLLGEGEAHVEIAFPDVAPIVRAGRLLVFNGGERDGRFRVLIHASTVQGSPAVIPVTTIVRGGSGIEATVEIPRIAGGNGSLLDFRLSLGRRFIRMGRSAAAFEAKCPDGIFKVSVKKLLFKNETQTPGEAAQTQLKGSLAVPCTSRG